VCFLTDLDQFQLGTLSHMICAKANGYQELPDWPEVAPDSSVRNVEVPIPWTSTSTSKVKASKKKPEKPKSFYSEDESSSSDGL
jgi:AP-3 complex subunit beta